MLCIFPFLVLGRVTLLASTCLWKARTYHWFETFSFLWSQWDSFQITARCLAPSESHACWSGVLSIVDCFHACKFPLENREVLRSNHVVSSTVWTKYHTPWEHRLWFMFVCCFGVSWDSIAGLFSSRLMKVQQPTSRLITTAAMLLVTGD